MKKTIKIFNENKLELIEIINELKKHIIDYEKLSGINGYDSSKSKTVKRIVNQIENLQKGSFKIMIVGEFSTGKSTFLNAILGENILPMAIKPTTATINLIKFNENKKIIVHYFGERDLESNQEINQGRSEEIPVEKLKEYSTSLNDDSDNVSKNIKLVEVLYPNDYCKEGVEILDTPGLNSVYEHHERATTDYLPNGNSGIMLFNAGQFLTKSESDYLKQFKKYMHKMFFVVNKIDSIDEKELEETIPFWKGQLKEILGENSEVRLYPLSAKNAIGGKVNESRLPDFLSDFESFLASDEKADEMIFPPILNVQTEIDTILSNIILKTKSFNFSPDEFEIKIKANEPKLLRAKRRNNEIESFILERGNFLKDKMKLEYDSLVRNGLQKVRDEISDFSGDIDLLKHELPLLIKRIFPSLVYEFQEAMEKELSLLNNDVASRVNDLRDDLFEFKSSILGENISNTIDTRSALQISSRFNGFDLAIEYGGGIGIGALAAMILSGPIVWIAAIGGGMAWGFFSREKIRTKQIKNITEKVENEFKIKLNELYPQLEEKFIGGINKMRNRTSKLFNNLIEEVEKNIREIRKEMQNEKETIERKIERYNNIKRNFIAINYRLIKVKQKVSK